MDVGVKVGGMTVNMTVTDKNKAIIAKKEFTAQDLFDVAKIDGDPTSVTVRELAASGFPVTATNFDQVMTELQKMQGTLKPRETTQITALDKVAVGKELQAQERAFFTVYPTIQKQRTAEAQTLGAELSGMRLPAPSRRSLLAAASSAPESAAGKALQAHLQTLSSDERQALVSKLKAYACKSDLRDAVALSIMVNVGETPQSGQTELNGSRQRFLDSVNLAAAKLYVGQGGSAEFMALSFHATGDGSGTSVDFIGTGGNWQKVGVGVLQYSDQLSGLGSVTNAQSRKEHREDIETGRLHPVLQGANQATFKLPNIDKTSDSPVVLGIGGNDGAGVKVTVQFGDASIHLLGGAKLRVDPDFALPGGYQFDATNQVLIPPKGVTPGDQGISVTLSSNKFKPDQAGLVAEQSDNPFDEMFVVARTLQVITPETTIDPVPVLPDFPPPPPATDGVGGFNPNSISLLKGSQVDKNVDAMADYVAKYPDVLKGMTIDLSSMGAVHKGKLVNEDDYAGKTYGAVVNGETLTKEATQGDRKSGFSMVMTGGKFSIKGQGSADPFKAEIQGVDRTKLKAFMDKHPKLKENDALGALRQFALLEAFQTKLNDRLQAAGKPPVDLLSTSNVTLARDGTAMSFADFKGIAGK
jgi:hypothetical protein